MSDERTMVRLGGDQPWGPERAPHGEFVEREGRSWYAIRDVDGMPPFFLTLASASDHWFFASSTGGLTAGRIDANRSLFPYDTVDKVTASTDTTGPLTVLQVRMGEGPAVLWEPFCTGGLRVQKVSRTLLKSLEGDALRFEEENHDLGMTFTYSWRMGERFGFVRTATITRNADQGPCTVRMLDGVRNVLPHGATRALQTSYSCLLDAYKRSERDPATGMGLFSLSSTLTDRAEPSEALRATTAWSTGLEVEAVLLTSDHRIDAFRRGLRVAGDDDVRGKKGAFLQVAEATIEAGAALRWYVALDVAQNAGEVGTLRAVVRDHDGEGLARLLEEDVVTSTQALIGTIAAGDGLSLGADRLATTHHFANTLFNLARGGVFVRGTKVEAPDFAGFVHTRNRAVRVAEAAFFDDLPDELDAAELHARAEASGNRDLWRLALEYLPLTWSRRHGDPSRPWNEFSIRLRNDDDTPRTDYQGNWRDIFQNWEPLAYSFPVFGPAIVAKFLNATTPDGYNPYRVTRDGIEWEVPEPDNPWSNIGYWGDHQIVYLQRLLEAVEEFRPGVLQKWWNEELFTSANVPYRIASYAATVDDPYDTIAFDDALEHAIGAREKVMGTDARLVPAPDGEGVQHVTMAEKLLTLLLAKLVSFVPGAGIWMNTQRPEWNDANNALAGKGVSVVTAAYLRRFVTFWKGQLERSDVASFPVSATVATLAAEIEGAHVDARPQLSGPITPEARRATMDRLGAAGTAFREAIYAGPTSDRTTVPREKLIGLLDVACAHLDHALRARRREDGLAHAYDVLVLEDGKAHIEDLDPMLEGQVALLSSGTLSPDEALTVLKALRRSALYWAEQKTYLLYPNKELPGFLTKNRFPRERIESSELVSKMRFGGDHRLVVVEGYDGTAAFGGDLRNAADLEALLDLLAEDARYTEIVAAERADILALFEEVFDHRAFTGRSGRIFAYEGLGSVYWHMVSKLLLAVQETFWDAKDAGASPQVLDALAEAYFDVQEGLGYRKSPERYGAFPTDPYSHTPETGGARQPGMTGQVKEELLTRLGEVGVRVGEGSLRLDPALLRARELVSAPTEFRYRDVHGAERAVPVPAGGMAFTFAQTPIVITTEAGAPRIRVHRSNGSSEDVEGLDLGRELSAHLFARDGAIRAIEVRLEPGRG
ncbi:MAG: hypothetical protein AAGH15_06095 [Myxococcota bacterium]